MDTPCSWDNPGHNPYTGSVPLAVYAYPEIPKETADRLFARMSKHQFDDVATITKDEIVGNHQYSDLRYMHFGENSVCNGDVSKSKWESRVEHGLVYCEDIHCIIVPTVCRNVALVTRVIPQVLPPVAIYPVTPLFVDSYTSQTLLLTSTELEREESATRKHPVMVPGIPGPHHGHPGFVPNIPTVPAIPEPSTYALMLLGLVLTAARKLSK